MHKLFKIFSIFCLTIVWTVSAQMTNAIEEAFQIFHTLTCVKFVPRSSPEAAGLSHQTYIYLTRG